MAGAPPMFGVIIPGRLVNFESIAVSETQLLFNIPDYDKVHHICVFMTGSAPLPEGLSAAVYLNIPNPQPAWYLLGCMGNGKPSVIYKFAKPKSDSIQHNMFTSWQPSPTNNTSVAQIGISIEPTMEANQKEPIGNTSLTTVSNFVDFTQKMLTNVFNYCSSFGVTQADMTPQPGVVFVPLDVLKKWYENFQRKMTLDPNFWKDLNS